MHTRTNKETFGHRGVLRDLTEPVSLQIVKFKKKESLQSSVMYIC